MAYKKKIKGIIYFIRYTDVLTYIYEDTNSKEFKDAIALFNKIGEFCRTFSKCDYDGDIIEIFHYYKLPI